MAAVALNSFLKTTGLNFHWDSIPEKKTTGWVWTKEFVTDNMNNTTIEYLRKEENLYRYEEQGLSCIKGLTSIAITPYITLARGMARLGYELSGHICDIWERVKGRGNKTTFKEFWTQEMVEIKKTSKKTFETIAKDLLLPGIVLTDHYIGDLTGLTLGGFGPGMILATGYLMYNPYSWRTFLEKFELWRNESERKIPNKEFGNFSFLESFVFGMIPITKIWDIHSLDKISNLQDKTFIDVLHDKNPLESQKKRYTFGRKKID